MELRGEDGDDEVDHEADQGHSEAAAGDVAHDGVELVLDLLAPNLTNERRVLT